jgi:energy-coupling factor transporter ATP-binding protein EcfA2/uncharacterized membrane protein
MPWRPSAGPCREYAVELDEVWFKYGKNLPDAVKDLSFKARYGELAALLGGNGAGKTTALSLIAGLIAPYRGSVATDGRAHALPQNPQSLFVAKTVREDLLEILSEHRLAKEEKLRRLDAMAKLCKLEELLGAHPYDLSGGEQQRAALAKVLLLQPKILLLDEPTKGLDAEFKQTLASILKELAAAGAAVIMVSHDIEFCAEHADRCALFFDGGIVTENTPQAFFSGNSFYTTAANRMARATLPQAITANDVIAALGGEPYKADAPAGGCASNGHSADSANHSDGESRGNAESDGESRADGNGSGYGNSDSNGHSADGANHGDGKSRSNAESDGESRADGNGRGYGGGDSNGHSADGANLGDDESRSNAESDGESRADFAGRFGHTERPASAKSAGCVGGGASVGLSAAGPAAARRQATISPARRAVAAASALAFALGAALAASDFDGLKAFVSGGAATIGAAASEAGGAWKYAGAMLLLALGASGLALSLSRGGAATPPRPARSPKSRKLPRRTTAAAAMVLLAIPLTIFAGMYAFGDRRYYFISLLIILETMLPFALVFESRRPQARELVVIAVLCAIAVAGRAAFFMLPQFKPVVAIVVIAGVAFGGESGFLVGAMAGFVSNMFFGQGPWTPWQMFAFGAIGFLAGILFRKSLLRRNAASLATYGALATVVIYGGLMNPAQVLMYTSQPTRELLLAAYLQGIPFDLVHAAATATFLAIIARPMLEKLDRIKAKYGLLD